MYKHNTKHTQLQITLIVGILQVFFSTYTLIMTRIMILILQLYEMSDDVKRKEFLDELFTFMQKRGKLMTGDSTVD